MQKQLKLLKNTFIKYLEKLNNNLLLENLEKDFIGKKGKLNEILKGIKNLNNEDKKIIGSEANKLKTFIIQEIEIKKLIIQEEKYKQIEKSEEIDITAQYPSKNKGHKHPISITSNLLEEIFISMGFKIEDGPQIEDENHNFDKLNIPDNHPARDVWDTFWLSDKINNIKKSGEKNLLRTHTSPVQIRAMLKGELPIKIIAPGRVFRYESEDASHTCNFYQLEGLMVGENITFGDLKWTLNTAIKKLLGDDTKTRFRPSIFPFTEPSVEIDISCKLCKGNGEVKSNKCKMCSATGWIELLGAGMVHPKVLTDVGIDPEIYSGFAFGMGIDRIAAQRFGVNSSRMFYTSKLKLNEQF